MRLGIVLVLAGSLAACEKAGPKASGKLSEEEAAMMARLPNKFGIAFGGNLPRLQAHLAKSPLTKFSRALETDGSAAWQDCLGEKQFKHMLGVVDAKSGFEMRFLMTGLEMSDLESCAKHAKLPHEVDSDRKYISIEIDAGGTKARLPYLVLDDGAIYGRFKLGLSGDSPTFEKPSRAKMEADITAAKSDSATENAKLIASMEKADRGKGVWFAGNAEGTLIGSQVHELYGTLDLEGGLEINATIELANDRLADQVMDGVQQARDTGGILGSEVKAVIDSVDVKRDDRRVRFGLKVSNHQLEKVFTKLGPMMGGAGRRDRLELE